MVNLTSMPSLQCPSTGQAYLRRVGTPVMLGRRAGTYTPLAAHRPFVSTWVALGRRPHRKGGGSSQHRPVPPHQRVPAESKFSVTVPPSVGAETSRSGGWSTNVCQSGRGEDEEALQQLKAGCSPRVSGLGGWSSNTCFRGSTDTRRAGGLGLPMGGWVGGWMVEQWCESWQAPPPAGACWQSCQRPGEGPPPPPPITTTTPVIYNAPPRTSGQFPSGML